jgi:hypothetical protein
MEATGGEAFLVDRLTYQGLSLVAAGARRAVIEL